MFLMYIELCSINDISCILLVLYIIGVNKVCWLLNYGFTVQPVIQFQSMILNLNYFHTKLTYTIVYSM